MHPPKAICDLEDQTCHKSHALCETLLAGQGVGSLRMHKPEDDGTPMNFRTRRRHSTITTMRPESVKLPPSLPLLLFRSALPAASDEDVMMLGGRRSQPVFIE